MQQWWKCRKNWKIKKNGWENIYTIQVFLSFFLTFKWIFAFFYPVLHSPFAFIVFWCLLFIYCVLHCANTANVIKKDQMCIILPTEFLTKWIKSFVCILFEYLLKLICHEVSAVQSCWNCILLVLGAFMFDIVLSHYFDVP